MQEYPNMLLVGGSKRNVGKTSLLLHLIKKYNSKFHVIGLKVTSIYGDEEKFHGNHNPLKSDYEIFEESKRDGIKDTSKMLLAGAEKVFYIRSTDKFIAEAFHSFTKQIPSNGLILCESISLRKFIKPGLFLLIQDKNTSQQKQSFTEMKPLADQLISTDGNQFDLDLDKINYTNNSWQILK